MSEAKGSSKTGTGTGSADDTAYDATTWNGSTLAPTQNAVRDKLEAMVLASGSGITRTVTVSSGNFNAGSAAATDYVYIIAGAHTPTLPTAVSNKNRYTLKNTHSASIAVATTSSQTIDGEATYSIFSGDSVDLVSDGSNWRLI